MALAALARHGATALDTAGLTSQAAEAAVRYAREPLHECRVASGRTAARLAAAGDGGAVAPVFQALLGPDQSGEVQRQALVSLRRLAVSAGAAPLSPHLPAVLPCVAALLQRDPNSQLRAAAEAALKHVLGLGGGDAPALDAATASVVVVGGTARSYLTDSYLRRLAKLAEDDWEDPEDY